MNSRETFRMRSDWLSLQCFGMPHHNPAKKTKLFSLLHFFHCEEATSTMRRMMRSLSLRQFSDDLIGSCLCTSFVSTCQDIYPWKLTCPPKRDHFVQGHETSSNHQFSWDIPWFSRGYVQWVWYLFHTDGWWLMVHVEVFLEACPHCCYHGEKEASWIHIKTFQAKVPTFSELLHFSQEIFTSWIISQSSWFYCDAIFMTQMAERISTSGKVLVQCFMLVSRLKSRHMLHGMAFAKSNSRWSFQIFFVFIPTWGEWSDLTKIFSKGLKPPTRISR